MHDRLSTRDRAKKGLQTDKVKAAAKKDIEYDVGKAAQPTAPRKVHNRMLARLQHQTTARKVSN